MKDTTRFISTINASYAAQLPGADMADRFGFNSNIGLHVLFKSASNWIFGAEGGVLFGRNIHENTILNGLLTNDGNIINSSGSFTWVTAEQRGWTATVTCGRMFHLKKWAPNKNSGLEFRIGAGYMLHKIRYDMEEQNLPQLTDDYLKGYDRMSGGWMLTQYLGYRYFGNRKLINFFVGLEGMQGITQSLRTWNYDTNSAATGNRVDLLYGIRAGWTIPIYRRSADEIYFN